MLELHGHTGRIRTLAYAPDGRTLASGGDDHTIRLWDIPTGQCLRTLIEHTDSVRALVFSPNGANLLSGGWDDIVWLHPLKSGRKSRTLPEKHLGGVWSLNFRTADSVLFAGDGSGSLTVYTELKMVKPGRHLTHAYPISALAWSPDGKILATASLDRTLKLWEGDWMQPRLTRTESGWLRCLAWSNDGTRLAFGGDEKTVHLIDRTGTSLLDPLTGHTDRIAAVTFSDDGSRLISGSWDGTLRTWSTRDGRLLDVRDWGLGRLGTLVLSPDGMTAAAGMENTVLVWDTDGSGI